MTTAGIIVIGNEVLSGKVEDENASFLIKELRALGVSLQRISIIRDDIDRIAREVREMSAEYTWVFTSGGVGSTHDDVTMEAIAKAFGVPLEKHPIIAALLGHYYGEKINEAAQRMAYVPQGTELLGLDSLPFPLVRVKNVCVFPGVPIFLRAKFEILREELKQTPFVLKQIYVRVGETTIAHLMTEVQDTFRDVEIGSYPRFDTDDHRVKITVESRSEESVQQAVAALISRFDAEWVVRVE